MLDWDTFVRNKWHRMYEKLAFRKLRHSRTLEAMQTLEQFIRSVIGLKYRLTPAKIFKKKDDGDETEKDKSYFCSELVAGAYKALGLLPKDVPASQYWPGSFSGKGNLRLLGDSILEDEQIVIFDH